MHLILYTNCSYHSINCIWVRYYKLQIGLHYKAIGVAQGKVVEKLVVLLELALLLFHVVVAVIAAVEDHIESVWIVVVGIVVLVKVCHTGQGVS